jgi:hypothetical protein
MTGEAVQGIGRLMEVAETVLDTAKATIQKDDLLPVAFLLVGNEDRVVMIPLGWRNEQEKGVMVEMLRATAIVTGAYAAILVMDTFIIVREKEGDIVERPSQAADRKDAILVNVLTKRGDNRMIVQVYEKRDGAVEFKDRRTYGPDHIDSRFSRVFEPEGREQKWQT